MKAQPEAPSTFNMQMEDDSKIFDDYYCDKMSCGWEGTFEGLNNGKCPECGGVCRKVEG